MSNYDEKVAEGRTLAKRSEDDQWRLAELTWQAVREDGVTHRQWGEDIAVSYAMVRRYSAIWAQWGETARTQRPIFSDAYNMINEGADSPEEARERKADRQALSTIRKASPDRRADVARELLADPVVAEQIAEDIVEHVASDPVRTAHVISKRREAEPIPVQTEQPRPVRDYDAMVEQHVNGLSVALAAESSGSWTPSERSEALLYFLTQILGKRIEPTGEQAEFVNEKLENLFAEVEAYANSEVSG